MRANFNTPARIQPIFIILLIVFLSNTAVAYADNNIIRKIVSATVVGNGLLGDAPTNINVLLHSTNNPVKNSQVLDANNPGQIIPAGGYMQLDLGGTFRRNPNFKDSFTGQNKIRDNFNYVISIATQNPIVSTQGDGVQHGNWDISDDGDRLITLRPQGNNGLQNARATAGFKIIHLKPAANENRSTMDRAPYINGPAGTYGMIYVRIFDADGMLYKMGAAEVKFSKANGPQVRITNVGLATAAQTQINSASTNVDELESVHYQHVAANTVLENTNKSVPFSAAKPYALRFVLFAATAQQPDAFEPQKGINKVGYYIDNENPSHAYLVQDTNGNGIADQNDTQIGNIQIKTSDTKNNGSILASNTLTTSGDGKTGANGSILNVPLKVGSKIGIYEITVSLNDGNKVSSYVIVE